MGELDKIINVPWSARSPSHFGPLTITMTCHLRLREIWLRSAAVWPHKTLLYHHVAMKESSYVSGCACSRSMCRFPPSSFAMSAGNVASFSLGAVAGVCAAGAVWWATSRPPKAISNGLAPSHSAAAVEEDVKETPPSQAPAEPVAPEDRPADAPESCPGVSSDSVGLWDWKCMSGQCLACACSSRIKVSVPRRECRQEFLLRWLPQSVPLCIGRGQEEGSCASRRARPFGTGEAQNLGLVRQRRSLLD